MEHFLQGNVPIRHLLSCKTSFYVLTEICLQWSKWLGPKVDLDLDIDLQTAVDQAEESKIAMIKTIYDAKRKAIKTLNNAFYNASIVNLDVALATAQEGISASQKVITDLTKKITLKNAQQAASATQVAIVEAIGKP